MSMQSPQIPNDKNPWITCPYCGQDYVYTTRIKSTHETIWVCRKCDTVWEPDSTDLSTTGIALPVFMASHGRKADWGDLIRLEKPAKPGPDHD